MQGTLPCNHYAWRQILNCLLLPSVRFCIFSEQWSTSGVNIFNYRKHCITSYTSPLFSQIRQLQAHNWNAESRKGHLYRTTQLRPIYLPSRFISPSSSIAKYNVGTCIMQYSHRNKGGVISCRLQLHSPSL